MKYCSQCGSQLQDGQSFCSNCGAPVEVQQQETAQQEFNQPQQESYQYAQGQQQANFNNGFNGANGFKAPIANRNIAMCIILSIVTCGIYGLYWYFCIINDLNTASESPDDASAGMVLLLSIITCGIYGWVWLYKAGEKVDKIRAINGEASSNSSIIYILLAIFGLVVVDYCLIQSELNKVAAN